MRAKTHNIVEILHHTLPIRTVQLHGTTMITKGSLHMRSQWSVRMIAQSVVSEANALVSGRGQNSHLPLTPEPLGLC